MASDQSINWKAMVQLQASARQCKHVKAHKLKCLLTSQLIERPWWLFVWIRPSAGRRSSEPPATVRRSLRPHFVQTRVFVWTWLSFIPTSGRSSSEPPATVLQSHQPSFVGASGHYSSEPIIHQSLPTIIIRTSGSIYKNRTSVRFCKVNMTNFPINRNKASWLSG